MFQNQVCLHVSYGRLLRQLLHHQQPIGTNRPHIAAPLVPSSQSHHITKESGGLRDVEVKSRKTYFYFDVELKKYQIGVLPFSSTPICYAGSIYLLASWLRALVDEIHNAHVRDAGMRLQSDLARTAVGIAALDMMLRYLPVERA